MVQAYEEGGDGGYEGEGTEKVDLREFGAPVCGCCWWEFEDEVDGYDGEEAEGCLAEECPKCC